MRRILSRRLLAWVFVVVALAVAVPVALRPADPRGTTSDGSPPAPTASTRAALAGLQRQSNRLLDGGPGEFKVRLAELRGVPIVVNKWASWCGPCRYEFPFFQRLARKHRERVAFLGVDSLDARADALRFIREFPVAFPHYFDPEGSIARVFRGGRSFPTTAFYDAAGTLAYVHEGAYATQARLESDIRRYALNG